MEVDYRTCWARSATAFAEFMAALPEFNQLDVIDQVRPYSLWRQWRGRQLAPLFFSEISFFFILYYFSNHNQGKFFQIRMVQSNYLVYTLCEVLFKQFSCRRDNNIPYSFVPYSSRNTPSD